MKSDFGRWIWIVQREYTRLNENETEIFEVGEIQCMIYLEYDTLLQQITMHLLS